MTWLVRGSLSTGYVAMFSVQSLSLITHTPELLWDHKKSALPAG
jgi:hypothetical protein